MVALLVIKLPLILAKLANNKLPASVFNAIILPLKLAVLPVSSKLTVALGIITLPLKLPVLPVNARLTVALPLITVSVIYVVFARVIPPTLAVIVCSPI